MSATTQLGKVSVTPQGAWSSTTAYAVLDIVTNGGGSYIAKQAVPAGTALSNTSYWLQITEKGSTGGVSEAAIASTYSATSTYAVGDYVIYNDLLYRCKTAITTAESWTAAHWTVVNVSEEIYSHASQISELQKSQTGIYFYFMPVQAFEYIKNSSYNYVETSYSYTFRKGTKIIKKNSFSGMVMYININGTNTKINDGYTFQSDISGVKIRVSGSYSINFNDYIAVYLPTFPMGIAKYCSVTDDLWQKCYFSNANDGLIYMASHRRCILNCKVRRGDAIHLSDDYEVYIYKYKGTSGSLYETVATEWCQDFVFYEDCIICINIRNKNNTSMDISNTDLSSVLNFSNVFLENSKKNNILKDGVFLENTIVYRSDITSAQGLTTDGKYLYCFSGLGTCLKYDIINKTSEIVNVPSEVGHANSATYDFDNGHFYVSNMSATASPKLVVELDSSLSLVTTYSVGNNVDSLCWTTSGFYGITASGDIVKYNSDFSINTVIAEDALPSTYPELPTAFFHQGMESDGTYLYAAVLTGSYEPYIYIYTLTGELVGKRAVNEYGEFEDISINPINNKVYFSYMASSDSNHMRITECVTDSEFVNVYDLLESKSSGTNINKYKNAPMVRVFNNCVEWRGSVSSTDSGNIFRLCNAIMPKIICTFQSNNCTFTLGTSSAGLGNYTYPLNKVTSGDYIIDLSKILYYCNPLVG